jgi:hypothetical protein
MTRLNKATYDKILYIKSSANYPDSINLYPDLLVLLNPQIKVYYQNEKINNIKTDLISAINVPLILRGAKGYFFMRAKHIT